jgi:hypothetical protein
MSTRYFTRLQPEFLAQPLVRDRAPALRERGPRCGEVHQVLELLQPCAVFHRDQRREIPAVALQDDALALEDSEERLREALARVGCGQSGLGHLRDLEEEGWVSGDFGFF